MYATFQNVISYVIMEVIFHMNGNVMVTRTAMTIQMKDLVVKQWWEHVRSWHTYNWGKLFPCLFVTLIRMITLLK